MNGSLQWPNWTIRNRFESWYGLNCVAPRIHILKSKLLVPQILTVFEDRAFKEVIKWKEVIRIGPNPVWPVSLTVTRQDTDTGERFTWRHKERPSSIQGERFRRNQETSILLGLLVSRMEKKMNLCPLRHPVCGIYYRSPNKPNQKGKS